MSRHLSRRLPYYLTPEEAHAMIEAAANERDRLFLRVLSETGVRVSEALGIRLGDLGRDGIRVLGKGSKERVIFVQEGLLSSMLVYARERQLGRYDYIFASRKGGHITKQRADQLIKETASRADLDRSVHAHLFRHGYAINFLNCSGRLDALQEQLGHEDINTTRTTYVSLTRTSSERWPRLDSSRPEVAACNCGVCRARSAPFDCRRRHFARFVHLLHHILLAILAYSMTFENHYKSAAPIQKVEVATGTQG